MTSTKTPGSLPTDTPARAEILATADRRVGLNIELHRPILETAIKAVEVSATYAPAENGKRFDHAAAAVVASLEVFNGLSVLEILGYGTHALAVGGFTRPKSAKAILAALSRPELPHSGADLETVQNGIGALIQTGEAKRSISVSARPMMLVTDDGYRAADNMPAGEVAKIGQEQSAVFAQYGPDAITTLRAEAFAAAEEAARDIERQRAKAKADKEQFLKDAEAEKKARKPAR